MGGPIVIAVHGAMESDIGIVMHALNTTSQNNTQAVPIHLRPDPVEYLSFGEAIKDAGALAWQSAGSVIGAELGVSIVRTHFWGKRHGKEVRRGVILVAVATRNGPIIGSVPLDIVPGDMLPECNVQIGPVVKEWGSIQHEHCSDDILALGQHVANVLLHSLTLEPTEEAFTIN